MCLKELAILTASAPLPLGCTQTTSDVPDNTDAGKKAINDAIAMSTAMKDFRNGASNDSNFRSKFRPREWRLRGPGDFGYEQGSATQKWTHPQTKKIMMAKGKWVTVFRHHSNGSMRAVADIFNADGTPTVAPK